MNAEPIWDAGVLQAGVRYVTNIEAGVAARPMFARTRDVSDRRDHHTPPSLRSEGQAILNSLTARLGEAAMSGGLMGGFAGE